MKTNLFIRICFVVLLVGIYGLQAAIAQDKVYTKPDVMPVYSGGKAALAKFLKDNVKYPEEAKAANTKGTVTVSFIVEKSGGITGVEVVSGIGHGCDAEAMRVVRKMKYWFPGSVGGKPVRVMYKLPVAFPQK
jgi:protein TonB